MIKAIIFDLAGVIVDISGISKGYQELCEKHNKSTEKPWKKFREEWNKMKIDELSCDDYYVVVASELGISPEEIKNIFMDGIKINNEVKNLILELKENYKIGVLSNTTKDILNKDLELWDFREVAEVVTSCDDKVKKPDLEAMDLIIKRLGLEKEEVIFVDDKMDTVNKYSEHGVKCIRFENCEQLASELEKAGCLK
tara:strand:- start:2587 stop:3177 length:591 start_codon:yes stop_codon:yes gene_type:complete